MKFNPSKPILFLITRGVTTEASTVESPEVVEIQRRISAAAAAGIDLIQIREKNLPARVLFELTQWAVEITAGTSTGVLVNDRADIAAGAGAAGVHLTSRSIEPAVIRKTFGEDFVIGVSTHSLGEARAAHDGGADFAVLGPIFQVTSKPEYGPPLGPEELRKAARELKPFPLLALGGVSIENADECLRAGARGIAGISLFADLGDLNRVSEFIKSVELN